MNRPLISISSVALGAGLMYLFDPNQGRRRRAMLADQCNHLIRQSRLELDRGLRDARNRAQGVVAELRSAVSRQAIADDVLVERIRSKLGRCVTQPSAIRVAANQGRVTLTGPVRASESDGLVGAIERMRGVQGIDNRLERQVEEWAEPESQPIGSTPAEHRSWTPEHWTPGHWTPAARLCAYGAGGTLLAYLAARISPGLVVLGTAAAGLGVALSSLEPAGRTSQAASESEATGLPVELW